VPHLEDHAGGLGGGQGAAAVGDGQGERLLDEDVLAVPRRLLDQVGVRRMRGGEQDRVHVGGPDQVLERIPCPAAVARGEVCTRLGPAAKHAASSARAVPPTARAS